MKRPQLDFKFLVIGLSLLGAMSAHAAPPVMDSFTVQSYIRLNNGNPTSATTGSFVFGVMKGSTCIWAKRYSSVAINNGVINQSIGGMGTNVTGISNPNANPGECVANYSGTTLNSTLLNSGASAALSIRVYAETALDSFQPIWDISFSTAPTAMVAEQAISATSADGLAASAKTVISSGAPSAGLIPALNAAGRLDASLINTSAIMIPSSQVTGLGTAATANTGTSSGNVPVLDGSGRLSSTLMPSYTANRIVATDGSGNMLGAYQTVTTSSGVVDAGKLPSLNGAGKLDQTFLDTTTLPVNPTNFSATVPVNRGGTGQTNLSANALLIGNGTSPIFGLSPVNGNVVYGNGGSWAAGTPDTAGLVDRTNAQTIAGNKTFSNAATFSSTVAVTGAATLSNNLSVAGTTTIGTGGSAFTRVINCTIASAGLTTGTERTGTCTGATTASTVYCSPTAAPAAGWIVASVRISAANTIAVMPIRWTGVATWTTGFNCVTWVP